MANLIPLDAVADDQRPLIQAFRTAGSKSIHEASSVAAARASYEASTAANGIPREYVASVKDVSVGDADESIMLRVYDPRGPEDLRPTPVIVFTHGGGWVIGSLETHDPICRRLAATTGFPVVAVNYRLGPEHKFPTAHHDCRRAIEWVRDQATTSGWDPVRLVMVGDSAGGGLATVLASDERLHVTGTSVVAQALLYPVVNMAEESPSYQRVTEGFPLTADSMRWFAQHFLTHPVSEGADSLVSPLLKLRECANAQPPALIVSLGLDPLADEALEYAHLLAASGTYVELIHLPSHAHGIATSAGRVATGVRMIDRVAAFLSEQVADATDHAVS